jgi:hypothetical protein
MTNRISGYLSDDPHPLDRPEFAGRLKALQVLCLGMMLGTVAFLVGAAMVVRFALGGRPIMQNGALAGGIPIVTVIGAVVTLTAVAVATLLGPVVRKAGLKAVATTPPPPPEPGTAPDTEADWLWKVYAQGKFAEFGLADGAAILTAVLYHLSADWLMLVFVGGMLAYMAVRFPTAGRVRSWFDEAMPEVERERG